MTSDENKTATLYACIGAAIIFSALVVIVVITSYLSNGRRSPLYYCIQEIHYHENYNCDFSYFYEELKPKEETKSGRDLFGYYITTFTDDRKGEWYCLIECKTNYMLRGYKPEDVIYIDCDLAFETMYGD